MRKRTVIIISVVAAVIVAAGLSVLIWWLVTRNDGEITVIDLEGEGFDGVSHSAGFTSIQGTGDLFWLFYPTTNFSSTNRPIILFLDGVTGIPPSLWANFGMFGPLDINLNRREDSWVDSYNLLFFDAPMGTGFSTIERENRIPRTLEGHADLLASNLESFYNRHRTYSSAPLYIMGEGHGAQLALGLAEKLTKPDLNFEHNLQGVIIGNGIVSPALALSKLGFYLEELGYIDGRGRETIETFSSEINTLVSDENYDDAFEQFLTLGEIVNDNAGAIAVNLGYIIQKLTREETSSRNFNAFGMRSYLQKASRAQNLYEFMEDTVAPALGISNVAYDSSRETALNSFRSILMVPSVEIVEHLLQNTNVTVSIYNGNLDAVSNTPGQLEWINNLVWSGRFEFDNSTRQTLVVDRLVQGYFKETAKLKFYWINVAGVSVPYDSRRAMRIVLNRIFGTN
ncbi:uncharacterized protein LOC106132467 [Amyelois transitella]|uniref:uncharacterized protein LOC106132467 n=1 Tax=Amyelois transitella TaxID=680683 RepID=UPI00067E0DBE|nr:uncharacterized protein LOC106132467 [Amyelois transitella]